MEQIDLKHLIEQHSEVLTNGTKLKGYILDLYPQCKRGMVNILVAIQQCGIVAEMQASKNPTTLDMSRWKKVLDDDYGFAGATAETCLQMWCSAIGIQEKEKAKSTATSISSELQNSQKDWFEYDGTTLLRLKKEYQKYDGAIYVPYGVKSVGEAAFEWCSSLTSITIPDSVESIGGRAFHGCSGLTSIKVASRNAAYHSQGNCVIETANKVLVWGCKTSTIPDDGSVTSIGDNAFCGCTGLTSIAIPNSVDSIGDDAFCCTGLTSITIPDSVKSIGDYAFSGCTGLTSITIPDSVKSIGNSAFAGCENLIMITIPDSVDSIGDNAFCGCTGLTSITIPDSVESIGREAFLCCTGLTSITIPNSVESIGYYAFDGCTGLTSITIPNSMESIGYYAFAGCTGLTSITIPSSVKSIGMAVFGGCTRLNSIIFEGTKAQWKAIEKYDIWNSNTGSYVVHSTDGDISKNES